MPQRKRGDDLSDEELVTLASQKRVEKRPVKRMKQLLEENGFQEGSDRLTTFGIKEWLGTMDSGLVLRNQRITMTLQSYAPMKRHSDFQYYYFNKDAFKGTLYKLKCGCGTCSRGRGMVFYGSSFEQEKNARYRKAGQERRGITDEILDERSRKHKAQYKEWRKQRELKEKARLEKRKLNVQKRRKWRQWRNERRKENYWMRKEKERKASENPLSRTGDKVHVKGKKRVS